MCIRDSQRVARILEDQTSEESSEEPPMATGSGCQGGGHFAPSYTHGNQQFGYSLTGGSVTGGRWNLAATKKTQNCCLSSRCCPCRASVHSIFGFWGSCSALLHRALAIDVSLLLRSNSYGSESWSTFHHSCNMAEQDSIEEEAVLLEYNGVHEGQRIVFGLLASPHKTTLRWHLRRLLPALQFQETKSTTYNVMVKNTWSQWQKVLQRFQLDPN
eukprot:1360904-Amphidinium_carterae.1